MGRSGKTGRRSRVVLHCHADQLPHLAGERSRRSSAWSINLTGVIRSSNDTAKSMKGPANTTLLGAYIWGHLLQVLLITTSHCPMHSDPKIRRRTVGSPRQGERPIVACNARLVGTATVRRLPSTALRRTEPKSRGDGKTLASRWIWPPGARALRGRASCGEPAVVRAAA